MLKTRYDKTHVSEDLNEAIDWYRESLQLTRHDHPGRHVTLFNFSAVHSSRFMDTRENEDVEEVIGLCQESLATLPSLHPGKYFSCLWLQEAYLSRYRVQLNPQQGRGQQWSLISRLKIPIANQQIRNWRTIIWS